MPDQEQPTTYPLPGGYEANPGLDLVPQYADLRGRCPVATIPTADGAEVVLVTSYIEARKVLGRPKVFTREDASMSDDLRSGKWITDIDGPRHKALRDLVLTAFTESRAEQLRPYAAQTTEQLLGVMRQSEQPADLVAALAVPLTVAVISEILGIPSIDRAQFGAWARAFLVHGPTATEEDALAAARAHSNLVTFMTSQLAGRRDAPTSDLLSVLAVAPSPDPAIEITETERIRLAIAALVAGFETSASMIGNMVYWLLYRYPPWWLHLHRNPTLVPDAVEEMLRMIPVDARDGLAREARENVSLAGTRIPHGATVLVSRAAANRDPAAFGSPEQFDPNRYHRDQKPPRPHLTFGHGPHVCPGAHLARMELQEALGGLIQQFPDLRPATPEEELEWKPTTMRGLDKLLVCWD